MRPTRVSSHLLAPAPGATPPPPSQRRDLVRTSWIKQITGAKACSACSSQQVPNELSATDRFPAFFRDVYRCLKRAGHWKKAIKAAKSFTTPTRRHPLQPPGAAQGLRRKRMTPDTLMSLSVNAAVCPITEEREKRAAPRWQRSAPPAGGRASRREAVTRPSRCMGAAPEEGGGSWRSSWALGVASRREVQHPGPSCRMPPGPQCAPPGPQPKAESRRHARAGALTHPPLICHHDSVEHVLIPGHGGHRPASSVGLRRPRWSRGHARPQLTETPATRDAKFTSGGDRQAG